MSSFSIPWGAWYEETQLELRTPEGMSVDVLSPNGGQRLDDDAIRRSINAPLGADRIAELARGRSSACIVVDDLARPTRAEDILLPLMEEVQQAGVSANRIDLVVATGSHGPLSTEEISKKVGRSIAEDYSVQSHDCRSNLVETGITYGKHELQINRTFLDAELKITIGSVLPHSFAGFSGGAKMVLPGLADLASISRSHKFVQLGLRGGSDPNENQFRLEAEEIAKQLGLDFAVCVVTNPQRETIGVFSGGIVEAHRAACEQALQAFRTPLSQTYDCAILNAYPKDSDLVQAANVFLSWKQAKQPVVREDGLVILTSASSTGIGHHGLFSPEGISYREPGPLRPLRGRDLWIYTPNLSVDQVQQLYWDGYRVFSDRDELQAALESRLNPGAHIGVFPCAPMQQVEDLR